VIAVAVDPGRRDQAREGFEKLERREDEDGLAVGGGAGGLVEDPANAHGVGRRRRGAGPGGFGVPGSGQPALGSRFVLDAEAVEGEGRAGAVADEPLAAGAVRAVDSEEAAALEEAEDAALEDGREGAGVVGGEVRGLVEAHPVINPRHRPYLDVGKRPGFGQGHLGPPAG
jgi:hypothetical protein